MMYTKNKMCDVAQIPCVPAALCELPACVSGLVNLKSSTGTGAITTNDGMYLHDVAVHVIALVFVWLKLC